MGYMWVIFFAVTAVAAFATRGLMPLAHRLKLIDTPHTASRKKHERPMPLVGGMAITVATVCGFLFISIFSPQLLPQLSTEQWYALVWAIGLLVLGGYFDDRFQLHPAIQIFFPLIAAVILLASDFTIHAITNPAGGVFLIPTAGASLLLTFGWLMGMMYSTKLLDGLDGIASGMTVIGALTIFGLTQTDKFWEPSVGAAALIVAAAYLGFLFFNVPPARAFLGESGSLLAGFLLGLLAILSGSKIATTLIVMAIPVFDLVRVMVTRVWRGRSPFVGDRLHLHHLLQRASVPTPVIVGGYWLVGAMSGVLALILPTAGKMVLLVVLCVSVWLVGALLSARHPLE